MNHRLKLLGIIALAMCCIVALPADATAQCANGMCTNPGLSITAHTSPNIVQIAPVRTVHSAPVAHLRYSPNPHVIHQPVCYGGQCYRQPAAVRVYHSPPPPNLRYQRSFGISFHSDARLGPNPVYRF